MGINILDPTDKVTERLVFATSPVTAILILAHYDIFEYANLPDGSIASPESYLYHNDIQRERY